MNRLNRQLFAGAAALTAAACAASAGSPVQRVISDGKTLSTDVRLVNGRAYVPLTDMAAALGRRIVKNGDAYSLTLNAAASHRGGSGGKGGLAADISRDSWTLRVLSVSPSPGYVRQFGGSAEPAVVQQAGDTVIVVRCRLTNNSTATKDVYFDRSYAANTSLMDEQFHSYGPIGYDSRNTDYSSSRMLSGTVHEFALVFSVPADTRLSDLVYTVSTSGTDKSTDFRVSLKS